MDALPCCNFLCSKKVRLRSDGWSAMLCSAKQCSEAIENTYRCTTMLDQRGQDQSIFVLAFGVTKLDIRRRHERAWTCAVFIVSKCRFANSMSLASCTKKSITQEHMRFLVALEILMERVLRGVVLLIGYWKNCELYCYVSFCRCAFECYCLLFFEGCVALY